MDILAYLALRLTERAEAFTAATGYPMVLDDEQPPDGVQKWVRVETPAGTVTHHQHAGGMRRITYQPRFVCCSRTKDGLRDLLGPVRTHFDLYRLDPSVAASPLQEVEAGPDLLAGDRSDRRWSCTLVFALTTSAEAREE